jgi:D-glycerate 3-kinase
MRVAQLSLDDLYLRRGEREQLAAAVHPLLATRGVPGTHDVELGEAVLDALGQPRCTAIPRFDKSVDDRFPDDQWDRAEGPVDLILFEGWCVGAEAQPEADLVQPINALEREQDPDARWRTHVNAALAGPYQRLFGRIDMLLMMAAPSFGVVAKWRTEQEEVLREKLVSGGHDLGSGLMNAAQIARFVQHYERITRHILDEMPCRADLVIQLDADRHMVSHRLS